MTPALEAVIWGVIQGVTEFIPVSSSGHLAVIPRFFGIEAPDLGFSIALHVGTLAAVAVFFRRDIAALFTVHKKRGILVIFASLPVFICGLAFADYIKPLFGRPGVVGWMFVVNGLVLLAGRAGLRKADRGGGGAPGWRQALAVGAAQSLAILPGISRSGITIAAGAHAGLKREDAYRFSFLLFIPAVLLTFFYNLREAVSSGPLDFDINILIGAATSAAVGIAALKLLYIIVLKSRFGILALYSVLLGSLTLLVL